MHRLVEFAHAMVAEDKETEAKASAVAALEKHLEEIKFEFNSRIERLTKEIEELG